MRFRGFAVRNLLYSPREHSDGLDVLRDCQNDSFKSDADTSVDPTKRLNFGADDDHDVSTEQFLDAFLDTSQNETENSYRRLEEVRTASWRLRWRSLTQRFCCEIRRSPS